LSFTLALLVIFPGINFSLDFAYFVLHDVHISQLSVLVTAIKAMTFMGHAGNHHDMDCLLLLRVLLLVIGEST
jgi:hypothetical protein